MNVVVHAESSQVIYGEPNLIVQGERCVVVHVEQSNCSLGVEYCYSWEASVVVQGEASDDA